MSFNVQLASGQTNRVLLQWVNSERLAHQRQICIFSISQAFQDGFLFELLKSIDCSAFEDFSLHEPQKRMQMIEKYLERQFGKRLKWKFKQNLYELKEQNGVKQFTKLICYLSIHSKKKNQFISRILTLAQQSQIYLMQEMKKMETKMQNITEIKQIIDQIQYLEYQNENLKVKLQQMTNTNKQMLELYHQSENDNKKLKDELDQFRKEKCDVFAALNIDFISEYLQAYNILKFENEKNLDIIRQMEFRFENYEQNVVAFNTKIKDDYHLITSLNEEISRLKQIMNEKYEQQDWLQLPVKSSMTRFPVFKSASSNKENISKCTTSFGKGSVILTEWIGSAQQEDESCERSFIRTHNHELMIKLENMYSKYNQLNKENNELKKINRRLCKKNASLRKTLKQVQSTNKQFLFKYQSSQGEIGQVISRLRTTNLDQ